MEEAVKQDLNLQTLPTCPNLTGIAVDRTAGSEFWNLKEFAIGP